MIIKRKPLLAGGNMRGKLHVLGKHVSRARIYESPYLVASICTSSFSSILWTTFDVVCLCGLMM